MMRFILSLAMLALFGRVESTAWRVAIAIVWGALMLAGVARLVHDLRSPDSTQR